jgi:DNA-directed RNA polymerase specialized sigma24 family protein
VGTRRKDWTLAQESFDKLLRLLDADRERAGVQYERIRQKLMKFFEWRGCTVPDEYVDKTIDRVAGRIDDGTELRLTDPYAYFHGVALNLLHEYRREPASERQSISAGGFRDMPPALSTIPAPSAPSDTERQLACLDECVRTIPPDTRELLFKYHAERGRARQQLADELGVPLNALRIRMFRARVALERCVVACLNRPAVESGLKYPSRIGH